MAIYVTKKCPHCGNVYQSFQSGDQRKYGSPLLLCSRCNRSFWDLDIKEPALYGYKNLHELYTTFLAWFWLITLSIASLVTVVVGVYHVIDGESTWIIGIVLGGLFFFLFGYFIMTKLNERKHLNDKILFQQKQYDASMMRLKNTEYLSALADFDPLAKRVLEERLNGKIEHYAARPETNDLSNRNYAKASASNALAQNRFDEREHLSKTLPDEDVLSIIEKLKHLSDSGVITQEEFETKKASCLKEYKLRKCKTLVFLVFVLYSLFIATVKRNRRAIG